MAIRTERILESLILENIAEKIRQYYTHNMDYYSSKDVKLPNTEDIKKFVDDKYDNYNSVLSFKYVEKITEDIINAMDDEDMIFD